VRGNGGEKGKRVKERKWGRERDEERGVDVGEKGREGEGQQE
jgi:hypothetical protein